jgi:hypothetical protein
LNIFETLNLFAIFVDDLLCAACDALRRQRYGAQTRRP